MKNLILLVCMAALLYGCRNGNNGTESFHDTIKIHPALPMDAPVKDSVLQSDSIALQPVNGQARVYAYIRKGKHIIFSFENTQYDSVQVILTPDDSTGNICVAQIFMPDNSADGPFGRQLNYSLRKKGLYRLSVAENMMAGDPWEGVFSLRLQLIKK